MPEKRTVRQIIGDDRSFFHGIKPVNDLITLSGAMQDQEISVQVFHKFLIPLDDFPEKLPGVLEPADLLLNQVLLAEEHGI